MSASAVPVPPPKEAYCPREMVNVADDFCVDRYEGQLIDDDVSLPLSPYYSPKRELAKYVENEWQSKRLEEGNERAKAMPLPPLPAWQKQKTVVPRAISRRGVIPNAYVSGEMADAACRQAGKRLCLREEWIKACRGEKDQKFPYGDAYEDGTCNVFRPGHPGVELYDNPSINHTDPRLNQVTLGGKPLLRRTGTTPRCTSTWGDDAVYDMVGNLDEWIADEDGTFVGGFYSRGTKDGCDAAVTAHGRSYADYSTGFRCCADPAYR